ncbi:diguanylate cyclase (GGDEF)-like protein [Pseudomonas corrugata]|uniref:GGDEF domain-containing protein n=1 Tax=Pseudomonas corrugata TaxID=47879 RepID=UPI00285E7F52|nr:GGDEF domain-containing protein [Pseudomonas corrugata]MDR7284966.1 diguanylate cyclase (GGDEF)-like protein [Pseudomonas corrugata]
MSWVVEHARAIKRSCWMIAAVLSMLTVVGVVNHYQSQHVILLESQQALLSQRSAWGYSNLLGNLQTHKLQQSLLMANPPPQGCLPDEYIAGQQRATQTLSAEVEGLSKYTLRVPVHQLAPLPKPQGPRMSLIDGGIRMTSRQFLGYTCDRRYAVIQETQTRLQPQPLLPPLVLGPAVTDRLVVHVAVSHGQEPALYFDIRFIAGKAEFVPATGADWSISQPIQVQGEDRFFHHYANLHQGLQMRVYSDPLAPDFLPQFLRMNSLGLLLAAGILACLLLINWLLTHLINTSVVHHQAATHDFLTGLYNRRAAMTLTEVELARATRKLGSLCILMLDIDHFKRVNDTYGHDGGDQVLKFLAQLLTETVRQEDLVARLGGEEFLIVLPDTDLAGAQQMANRLVQTLGSSTLVYAGNRIGVTCSMGVSAWHGPGDSVQTLLIRGDLLLYQAKQQGRNRYVSETLPYSTSTAHA